MLVYFSVVFVLFVFVCLLLLLVGVVGWFGLLLLRCCVLLSLLCTFKVLMKLEARRHVQYHNQHGPSRSWMPRDISYTAK